MSRKLSESCLYLHSDSCSLRYRIHRLGEHNSVLLYCSTITTFMYQPSLQEPSIIYITLGWNVSFNIILYLPSNVPLHNPLVHPQFPPLLMLFYTVPKRRLSLSAGTQRATPVLVILLSISKKWLTFVWNSTACSKRITCMNAERRQMPMEKTYFWCVRYFGAL